MLETQTLTSVYEKSEMSWKIELSQSNSLNLTKKIYLLFLVHFPVILGSFSRLFPQLRYCIMITFCLYCLSVVIVL